MKWVDLESRSTITQIESNLRAINGKPTMKSILISSDSILEYSAVAIALLLHRPSDRYRIQKRSELSHASSLSTKIAALGHDTS
jgi:hypothetical protein